MTAELNGPSEVLAFIAKTVDNIDPERTDVPTWRNSEVLEMLEDIAAGLQADPEWAEVTISEVLAERDALRKALADHEITDAIVAEIFTAGLRQVEGERDAARSIAVRLEQDLAEAARRMPQLPSQIRAARS